MQYPAGQSVAACVEINGKESCITADQTMKECLPVTHTVSGAPCAFPFWLNEAKHHKCVDQGDGSVCKTPSGDVEECVEETTKSKVKDVIVLPGRVTTEGEPCMFPFWFEVGMHFSPHKMLFRVKHQTWATRCNVCIVP